MEGGEEEALQEALDGRLHEVVEVDEAPQVELEALQVEEGDKAPQEAQEDVVGAPVEGVVVEEGPLAVEEDLLQEGLQMVQVEHEELLLGDPLQVLVAAEACQGDQEGGEGPEVHLHEVPQEVSQPWDWVGEALLVVPLPLVLPGAEALCPAKARSNHLLQ